MTNLTEFTKQVAPDVIGCPDVLIQRAMIATIRDFCTKTWVLSRTLSVDVTSTDIDSTLNQSIELDLSEALDSATKAIAFKSFLINQIPYPLDHMDAVADSALIKSVTGKKFFTFLDDTTALVYPFTGACTIDCEIVFVPTVDATSVNDILFDSYLDGIMVGSKARLFRQPGKNWTALDLVPYLDREYRRAVVEAKRSINKEFNRGSLMVQPRTFGEMESNDNTLGYVFE